MLFRNSFKLGKYGPKMPWGRGQEKTVLRSVSLQNMWRGLIVEYESSFLLSRVEHSAGRIFYLLFNFESYYLCMVFFTIVPSNYGFHE